MGGRLTEFDQYETLPGWGTPRPVYGPKPSAVPIGSHLRDDRPKIPQKDIKVGPNGVEISLTWEIGNESKHSLNADYRIRLSKRKSYGRNDEVWFEYHPNQGGVVKDIVSEKTGRAHKIITKHGGSVSTKARAVTIPANRRTTIPIGITIPGPAQGREMEEFWKDRKDNDFNLLVSVYQGRSGTFEELDKGEHEFKDVLKLEYKAGSMPTPTRVPTPELPAIRPTPAPTTELPAIPYGKWDRTFGVIPSWFKPDSGKVPTRTSKRGFTTQVYDPETGDPW
jgi:hypothetical protein